MGTSGDYPPFSDASGRPFGGPDGSADLEGFEIEVVRAFAHDHGLALEWVPFRWPDLRADLADGRFDAAASGVTVRPERSRVGRFSVPVARSGAVALVAAGSPATGVEALDRPGVRIAVNRGGHLERVARARFPRAALRSVPGNSGVIELLAQAAVDAVVTDTLEAPLWQRRVPGSRALGPFTTDRKAWLVRADAPALARAIDAWLVERERDGTLGRLRRRQLGPHAAAPTALVLDALLAALDERLALMPAVAEAKRASGRAVEDLAREERIIAAGLAAVERECNSLPERTEPCSRFEPGMHALLRASIEAAKTLQRRRLAEPAAAAAEPVASLEAVRPALLRIGEHIAWLVVRLPSGLEALDAAVARELARHALSAREHAAFARAIQSLSAAAAP